MVLRMTSNPFDYLNAINSTKEDLLKDALPEDEKKYNSFIVNRGLSYFSDSVLFANEMNRYHMIDNKMQFDFLRLALRKRKRFSKWNKAEDNESINVIKQYYGYNDQKATEVLDLLSPDDISVLRKRLFRGGTKKYK